MGFGRESNYGALGFKATRGSRATASFSPLIQYRTSSRSSIETSFNGTDFEQTNRFPVSISFLLPAYFRAAGMRVRGSASARLPMVPFPLSYIVGRLCHSPIRFPALSPRPLDCIDHRWRGCTRRKRLVYSCASYRYVNGESRSRCDHTCIRGPRVHFRTRLRLFETTLPPLSGFAKQFVAIESWSVRFHPFYSPTSTRALNANKQRVISCSSGTIMGVYISANCIRSC